MKPEKEIKEMKKNFFIVRAPKEGVHGGIVICAAVDSQDGSVALDVADWIRQEYKVEYVQAESVVIGKPLKP